MYTRDEGRARALYTTSFHRGLNLFYPVDALQDGMISGGMNFVVKRGVVIPAGGSQEVVTSSEESIDALFYFEQDLILLTPSKAFKFKRGTLTEITPSGGFEETPSGWTATVGLDQGTPHLVLNSYGENPLYYWNTTFAALTKVPNAPLAKTCLGYRGRLLLGNVYSSSETEWLPYRLQWSAINDLTTWESGTAGFYDFIESTDEVLAFISLPEDVLLVLRSESLWVGYPTGDAYDPLSLRLLARIGLATARSVQSFGAGGVFLGVDDVYMVTPEGPKAVGAPVRDQILSGIEEAVVWSFIDVKEKLYYLVVDDIAWIYNYEEDAWSRQEMENITCLGVWYVSLPSP